VTIIVYAAADYIPPPGVTVLPIDAHPAIVEDRLLGHTEPLRDRQQYGPGCRGLTLQEIVAILRNGPATVAELADQVGVSKQAIEAKLRSRGRMFAVVGRQKSARQGQPALLWGLR